MLNNVNLVHGTKFKQNLKKHLGVIKKYLNAGVYTHLKLRKVLSHPSNIYDSLLFTYLSIYLFSTLLSVGCIV